MEFYKAWDRHGALSNFSPHSVELPEGPVRACGALGGGPARAWPSVEHFYQAQKFAGVLLPCPPFSRHEKLRACHTRRRCRVCDVAWLTDGQSKTQNADHPLPAEVQELLPL